jgi:hypothetical protein
MNKVKMTQLGEVKILEQGEEEEVQGEEVERTMKENQVLRLFIKM